MEQQELTPELFLVDDLLDFSNDDGKSDDGFDTTFLDSSSTVSAANLASDSSGSNSSSLYTDGAGFSDDLCVPSEHLAELEWLSNLVEDSFSKEDQDKLHLLSGLTKPHQTTGSIQIKPEPEPELDQIYIQTEPEPETEDSNIAFPAKARSKRPRSGSRLLSIAAGSDQTGPKKKQHRVKETELVGDIDGDGRRCMHCATDKTPQWRTGPMGPKTLCNACGVRYKSGRLVPEYRPASSPTFVMARHSNSHRKVMELRRQKEMRDEDLMSQHLVRSNGGDYLIRNHNNNNNHVGRDYRHF